VSEDDEYLDRRAVSGSGTGIFVGLLLCAVLLGGLGAIVATVRTHNLIAIIVVVVAVLVAASRLSPLIIAPLSKGTVRLSSRGILTSGPLLQLQVDWAEIVAIDVLRRGRGRAVSVLLRDGNRRELAAPREQGSGRSAEFDEQVAKIVRWWETHRPADFVPPDEAGGVARRRRYRRAEGTPRRRVVRPRPTLSSSRGSIEDAAMAGPAVAEPAVATAPAVAVAEPGVAEPSLADPGTAEPAGATAPLPVTDPAVATSEPTAAPTEPIAAQPDPATPVPVPAATTPEPAVAMAEPGLAAEPSMAEQTVAEQSMVIERPRRGRWRR
jgi:hypothetical protein